MSIETVSTALCVCDMGCAPCPLNATNAPNVELEGKPAGTIMDHMPMKNLATFGLCRSLENPAVAAATAAAWGVLTPMPCMPATLAPWVPGGAPTIAINGIPIIDNNSLLSCAYSGKIKITSPGQISAQVP